MKINHLFPLAVLLTAGWLPALTPNQSAWQQAAAKVKGTLNATGSLAKQSPGSDTGKVNALATHLDQLTERVETLQLAFGAAMQDATLTGDSRKAYLTQAGNDLKSISDTYSALRGDISSNFSSMQGGDFLVSLSNDINVRLSRFLSSYTVQAQDGQVSDIAWTCAHIIRGGDM